MGVKVSNLPQGTIIAEDDLIYAVINGVSVKMLKSDFAQSLQSTGDDGHISGVIEWTGVGLTFKSVELYWRKNNTIFYSNGIERTSVAADPTDPRIDTFYGDDSGDWGIIEGTPAASPIKPTVTDVDTQIEISFTLILAGATTPSDYTNITVYDEVGTIAGGETDVTLTGGTLNSTEQAHSGTKSIKFTTASITAKGYFKFSAVRETSDLVSLKFWVYLETSINNKFWVRLYNLSLTQQIGQKVIVQNSTYGFDSFLLNTWQEITIPASAFNVGILQYGQILFQNKKAGATFFLDEFILQEGNGGVPIPSNIFARDVQTDTANFDNNLSSSDTTVQEALDTIDDLVIGVGGGDVTGGASSVDENIAIYNGVTGKIIKDGLINKSAITANTAKVGLTASSVGLTEVKDIFKKVLTNATVITTQNIDWDAYSGFIFTMTGATTFSDLNLPATPNETQISILMTGDFAATFPTYYKFGGDTYDGTVWNYLAIECKDNTGSSEQVVCLITNLT